MSNSTSTTSSLPATSTETPPPSSASSSANTEPTAVPTSSNPFSTSTFSSSPPPSSSTPSTSSSEESSAASSTTPTSTEAPSTTSEQPVTSVTTVTSNGSQLPVTTIIRTLTSPDSDTTTSQQSSSSAATSTPGLADNGTSPTASGLSGGGKIAVEVIVPIVGVALLVLAGLYFWRKRKQRKDAEEIRRKEVEEYGYNPNDDPTLPAVGGVKSNTGDGPFEMREDDAGYRGWGTTVAGSSGRKASTTLSGGPVGMAYSEGTSPSHAPISDARSGDTLIGSPSARPTSNGHPEEVLGAMGPSAAGNRSGDMHRGPSNASSSYSAANRSDGSGEGPLPGGAHGAAQYYSGDANYGSPYADGSYGGGAGGRAEMSGQPVIRDNLARRATRIENPSHFPTQASAGISQNF